MKLLSRKKPEHIKQVLRLRTLHPFDADRLGDHKENDDQSMSKEPDNSARAGHHTHRINHEAPPYGFAPSCCGSE